MNPIERIFFDIVHDPINKEFIAKQYPPIFMANSKAKILIIGQAPGLKTQKKGIVFQDKSGDRLRAWLGVDEATFYESGLFAVLPMDFYFPGKGKSGDLAPRNHFAPKWHPKLIAAMPNIQLTILIGAYAQNYYLQDRSKDTLTETIIAYEEFLPDFFVLPHPSPLNFRWFHNNPAFQESILPVLSKMVNDIL